MVAVRFVVSSSWAALVVLIACSCAPAAPSKSAREAGPGRAAKVVNATIVTNSCQTLGAESARLAERAMYDLVEGCASVPGGTARFHATLDPGGRIEITAGPGQPQVIPICVLKHSLLHKIRLVSPCGLDVDLEETRVAVAPSRAPP
jgi:hypothetical protein